jgi:hypothetical protein
LMRSAVRQCEDEYLHSWAQMSVVSCPLKKGWELLGTSFLPSCRPTNLHGFQSDTATDNGPRATDN